MPYIPYNKSESVTPSNSVDLPGGLTKAVYVAGAGTITVVYANDATQQFTAIAGALLPLAVKRVNATGTAATGIVALYQV